MKTYSTVYTNRTDLSSFVESLQISSQQVLVQVFCGISNEDNFNMINKIREDILYTIPSAKIVGGLTTNSLIANGEVLRYITVISITTFEHTEIETYIETVKIEEDYHQGKSIAEKLFKDNTKVMFMFPSISKLTFSFDSFLEGVSSVDNNVAISGGVLLGQSGQNCVFTERETIENGVAVAALHSDILQATMDNNGGWRTIGMDLTITKCDGKVIKEIENIPATEFVERYTSQSIKNDAKSIEILERLPFMRKKVNTFKALVPSSIIDDKYIQVDSNVYVGEKIRIGYSNLKELYEGANDLFSRMNKVPVESVFIYSCEMREKYMDELIHEELKPIGNVAMVTGLFTDGEFTKIDDVSQNTPYRMTVLMLSEDKEARIQIRPNNPNGIEAKLVQNRLILMDVIRGADRDFNRINEELKDMITEKVEELSVQLYRDSLTNLYNRAKLMDEIDNESSLKLALIDIQSFHEINGLYGNKIGDQILLEYSQRLNDLVDVCQCDIYRVSSDVFAITSNNQIDDEFVQHIQRYEKELLNFFYMDEENLLNIHVLSNIGISLEKENIFEKANMALQFSKDSDENVQIYTEQMDRKKEYENNLVWVNKINKAIAEDRFVPFFQPIYRHESGQVSKYEALMRLIDTDGKVISPFFFLDIAIKTHLYPVLSRSVMSKVFDVIEQKGIKVCINLLIEDIRNPKTMELIRERFSNSEVAKRVTFEIVEGEGIEKFDEVKDFINFVHDAGAKIAIDDFGTGYSNFKYLTELEVDIIKIDGSLIKDICKDNSSKNVTEIIIDFSSKIGAEVVAEFVSDEDIFNLVESLGVTYSQGYFISEPKAESEI